MEQPPSFEDQVDPQEAPDLFARMVDRLRRTSGYDPGAEEEAHDERAARRTLRWAGRTVLFATLILAVLNAASLHSWATSLPANWGGETVRELADVWNQRLSELGLDRPRKAIRGAYEGWKGNGAVQAPPR